MPDSDHGSGDGVETVETDPTGRYIRVRTPFFSPLLYPFACVVSASPSHPIRAVSPHPSSRPRAPRCATSQPTAVLADHKPTHIAFRDLSSAHRTPLATAIRRHSARRLPLVFYPPPHLSPARRRASHAYAARRNLHLPSSRHGNDRLRARAVRLWPAPSTALI
jgi:hypothetical protein